MISTPQPETNGHPTTTDATTSPPPLRLAIIGGGIGGLSLLLGILHHCSRRTVLPHLFESAPAFSEIGAGVGFGPNSVRAMRVISPQLWESYDRIAADSEMVLIDGEMRAQWHQFHMGMDGRGTGGNGNSLKAGDQIARIYNDNRKKNVHRATFLDEMIKLLPGGGGTGEGYVSFKKRCVDVEEVDEGVRIHFADGTTERFHAVIGCDGVKSRVRKILLGDSKEFEPRFTGKYAYRGLVPIADARKAVGDLANVSHMFWGYGGHLVDFPIDKGATLNIVAFQTKKDGKWEHDDWVVPGTTEQALEDFKDWSQPVRDLIANLKSPSVWALFEHPPASTYHRNGRICLLGDCAHASTPHQGAGAGMAIEDAALLSKLLGHISNPDPAILTKVFEAYDQVRRPRSQKLVTTSRDAGQLYDFQKEGVLDDPQKLKESIEQRMRWIWEMDTEAHCAEAIKIMDTL
jgi:salicylate hydroxylase